MGRYDSAAAPARPAPAQDGGARAQHEPRADFPRWQQMSPDQRQFLQQREQHFRALPQEEQQRVRQAEQRYRSMSDQQREDLRRRWEGMSEEERERYRQRIRERNH